MEMIIHVLESWESNALLPKFLQLLDYRPEAYKLSNQSTLEQNKGISSWLQRQSN